jgi:hypothetical protein
MYNQQHGWNGKIGNKYKINHLPTGTRMGCVDVKIPNFKFPFTF